MNIRKDKLVRCAEGLGLRYYGDSVYIENWETAWDSEIVPILFTYAPGGIMDKMGWEPEYAPGCDYAIITQVDGEIVIDSIKTFNNIPAAAIDAYLNTLEGENGETDNNISKIEDDIEVMKVKLDQMNCELKRPKEGR